MKTTVPIALFPTHAAKFVPNPLKSSKKKITEEYLLKCEECGHVFKDMFSVKKPIPYRLIISEQDKSHKTTIDLSPSDELKVGDVLLSDLGQVEVTSIEVNDKRLKKS